MPAELNSLSLLHFGWSYIEDRYAREKADLDARSEIVFINKWRPLAMLTRRFSQPFNFITSGIDLPLREALNGDKVIYSMAAEDLAGHSASYRDDGITWRAALMRAAGVPLASDEEYEEYVASLRNGSYGGASPEALDSNTGMPLANGLHAGSAYNEQASGRSGDIPTFRAGVSRVLDHLGLHFG